MMKLDQLFKDEAANDENTSWPWKKELQHSMPQFLALCFNHNAGQLFFQPVAAVQEYSGPVRYDLINSVGRQYLGKNWIDRKPPTNG